MLQFKTLLPSQIPKHCLTELPLNRVRIPHQQWRLASKKQRAAAIRSTGNFWAERAKFKNSNWFDLKDTLNNANFSVGENFYENAE